MYATLVDIHSLIRWVIVAVSVAAVLYALYGLATRPTWRPLGDQLGLLFTWSLRINLLLGIVLWVIFLLNAGFNVFYTIIHPLLMFAALALAEIFAVRRGRAENDRARWTSFALGTIIPVLLVMGAIPWDR